MRCSAGKGAHYRSKPGARSSSTPQGRIPRGSSYQPAFGKGHRAAPCDDEMVEHLNIDQGQRAFERACEDLVGMARLCDPEGWLCAKITAAALCRREHFTTSRG